jgi:hypothetical protein
MTRAYTLVPLFLTIALGAGRFMAAPPGRAPRAAVTTSVDTNIRECPQAHAFDTSSVEPLLTSGTAGIPEYNDCQRFIVKGGFDSLYAIYATHPQTISLGPKVAVLVAVIRSFGGTYPALGIKPGLNCVYLSGDRRLARVVDSATFFPCCPIVALSRLPAPFLESRPTVAKGFLRDADYPQVARWDWDAQHRMQYLGLKCDVAWCEIGPRGFVQSPAWTPVATLPYRTRRNLMIKGWYDEQILAGPLARADSLPAVSAIRGTIFPDSSLNDYTDASFQNTWRVIAYIAVPRTSEKYVQLMNLRATPFANPLTPLDPRKLNTIEFCVGTPADCGVTAPVPTCPPAGNSGATNWGWSKITPAGGGAPKYKCVNRWSNATMSSSSGVPVSLPAATRWRWVIADDLSWSKCSAGCCEVH